MHSLKVCIYLRFHPCYSITVQKDENFAVEGKLVSRVPTMMIVKLEFLYISVCVDTFALVA